MTPIIRIRLGSQRKDGEIQYTYKMSKDPAKLIVMESEDWIPVNKDHRDEAWIAAPSGALLLALREALRAIHEESEDLWHAALLIENTMHSSIIDTMVFHPKGGSLYQDITRELNQHPVRVSYDASIPPKSRDNAQYPWPISEDQSALSAESSGEIEQLRSLVKDLEAELELAEDQSVLSVKSLDEIERLHNQVKDLETELELARIAKESAYESVKKMQSQVSHIRLPALERMQFAKTFNELNESQNKVDELQNVNAQLEKQLQLMAKTNLDKAESSEAEIEFREVADSFLRQHWGSIVWDQLNNDWKFECIRSLVIAQMIERFDPMNDASYEWPAFLLARNTERLLNDWMIPAFREWMSQQEKDSNFNHIGEREDPLENLSWKIYIRKGEQLQRNQMIRITDSSNLSIDKIRTVFWNNRQVERPNELQEGVSQFFEDKQISWMQGERIGKKLDELRLNIRNPSAHGAKQIDRTLYDHWVRALIGPRNSSDTPEEAWWPAWIRAFRKCSDE